MNTLRRPDDAIEFGEPVAVASTGPAGAMLRFHSPRTLNRFQWPLAYLGASPEGRG